MIKFSSIHYQYENWYYISVQFSFLCFWLKFSCYLILNLSYAIQTSLPFSVPHFLSSIKTLPRYVSFWTCQIFTSLIQSSHLGRFYFSFSKENSRLIWNNVNTNFCGNYSYIAFIILIRIFCWKQSLSV